MSKIDIKETELIEEESDAESSGPLGDFKKGVLAGYEEKRTKLAQQETLYFKQVDMKEKLTVHTIHKVHPDLVRPGASANWFGMLETEDRKLYGKCNIWTGEH